MSEHSRRSFLKQASLGAAAVGAVTVLPTASAEAATPDTQSGPTHDGPFAVWVNNARTGEIAVLVGETEVIHHDRALARTLSRIAARGAKS